MYLELSIPDTSYADAISRLLLSISRPASVRNPYDASVRRYSYVVHPETGAVALDMPEGDLIYVHPDCDADALVNQIADALAGGEAVALRGEIDSRRGQHASPLDLIPASAQTRLYTRAEMAAAGWFPEPEL